MPASPPVSTAGVRVKFVADATITVDPNRVSGTGVAGQTAPSQAGIYLYGIHRANVFVRWDDVSSRDYGVAGRYLTSLVRWRVKALTTRNVTAPVFWDETVANPTEMD